VGTRTGPPVKLRHASRSEIKSWCRRHLSVVPSFMSGPFSEEAPGRNVWGFCLRHDKDTSVSRGYNDPQYVEIDLHWRSKVRTDDVGR